MDLNSCAELCPRCREKGQVRRLLFVYYNRAEAFSTCESKNCVYFVTDAQGDLVKFRFNEELKRLVPLAVPAKTENVNAELEKLMQSLRTTNSNAASADVSPSSLCLHNNFENMDSSTNYSDIDIDSFLNELVHS